MGLIDRLKHSTSSTKIAITWSLWATVTLTAYYLFRVYNQEHRSEALNIRRAISNEFDAKIESARLKVGYSSEVNPNASQKIWINSVKGASRS